MRFLGWSVTSNGDEMPLTLPLIFAPIYYCNHAMTESRCGILSPNLTTIIIMIHCYD